MDRSKQNEPFLLAYYAYSERERYEGGDGDTHLQRALQSAKQAVQYVHDSNGHFAAILDCYAGILEAHYKRFGALDDLEEAIRVIRKAVEATPHDSSDLAGYLNNLGNKLECRFGRLGTLVDLEEAIYVARKAVEITLNNSPDLTA